MREGTGGGREFIFLFFRVRSLFDELNGSLRSSTEVLFPVCSLLDTEPNTVTGLLSRKRLGGISTIT